MLIYKNMNQASAKVRTIRLKNPDSIAKVYNNAAEKLGNSAYKL